MTTDKRPPDGLGDLLFTWDVLVARREAAPARYLADEPALSFTRLAAATPDAAIEGEPWTDDAGLCRVKARVREDRLYLSLQADGFAALDRLAGRAWWLVSHDGAVRAWCGFDDRGAAEVVLRHGSAVTESLRDFALFEAIPSDAD